MKIEFSTDKFKTLGQNLKRQVEENPLVAMFAAGALFSGASALVNANTKRVNAKTARKNSKTYEKEIDRRIKSKK